MIREQFIVAPIASKLAAIIGLIYIVVCVLVAAFPYVLSIVDWNSAFGLYTSAAIDLIVGLIFIWAARWSSSQIVFNVLGTMLLLGAVFYLLLPVDIWSEILNWWMIEHLTFTRIACVVIGVPFGVMIIQFAIASPK